MMLQVSSKITYPKTFIKGEIISLPPVINSKYSQISVDTTDILLEVTAPSTSSLQMCKDVMATLLKRMVQMLPLDQQLVVEQVKIQGENGHVRIQYPSQKDLEEICAQ
jgi:phenylalanyl-tRNA synthetase beta subunit